MKKQVLFSGILMVMLTMFSGCEAIAGIFKAGVWSGVLMVVVFVGLLIFLIGKMFGKKGA